MYKDPQASEMAKRLREELARLDKTELTHSQALELLARIQGARTLHVAQAKNNAGVRIDAVAREQAAAVMFKDLGRYAGNLDGLLEELKAFKRLCDESGDCALIDAEYRRVFRREDSPELAEHFGDDLRGEEFYEAFMALQERLATVMRSAARAPQAPQDRPGWQMLYRGPMVDWMNCQDGVPWAEMPEHRRRRYEMTLERSTQQLYVQIAPPHEDKDELAGKPQMGLFIEVNDGLPCVHLSNDVQGDQVLTVFATEDGLYLRPDSSELWIRSGEPAAPALKALDERERLYPSDMNNMFIESSNRLK